MDESISKSPVHDISKHVDTNDSQQTNEEVVLKDNAIKILRGAGHSVELTQENNRRVLRKIDLRVLPVILGIYFLQALDKASKLKLVVTRVSF